MNISFFSTRKLLWPLCPTFVLNSTGFLNFLTIFLTSSKLSIYYYLTVIKSLRLFAIFNCLALGKFTTNMDDKMVQPQQKFHSGKTQEVNNNCLQLYQYLFDLWSLKWILFFWFLFSHYNSIQFVAFQYRHINTIRSQKIPGIFSKYGEKMEYSNTFLNHSIYLLKSFSPLRIFIIICNCNKIVQYYSWKDYLILNQRWSFTVDKYFPSDWIFRDQNAYFVCRYFSPFLNFVETKQF